MLGSLVTGTTGLIFPMFASYRALASNDISLIRPWLMYWVVFATLQFAEDLFRPIVRLVPFYGLFKAGALLWLVLPQTQGAVQVYQTRLEPWLRSHNQDIDYYINTFVSFVNSTPLPTLLRLVGVNFPSNGHNGGAGGAAAAADGAVGSGVLDSVLSSFRQTGNPDANLSAYIPSIIGGGGPTQGEAGYAAVRNRLMGMLRSLDTSDGASNGAPNGAPHNASRDINNGAPGGSAGASTGASSSFFSSASTAGSTQARNPDSEAFDFVEVPRGTTPGSTEIEREVQQHWK